MTETVLPLALLVTVRSEALRILTSTLRRQIAAGDESWQAARVLPAVIAALKLRLPVGLGLRTIMLLLIARRERLRVARSATA